MTALDLLARLDAEATPGPWEPDVNETPNHHYVASYGPWRLIGFGENAEDEAISAAERDAILIAAIRNALPEIIEALRAGRGCCDRLLNFRDSKQWRQQAKEAAEWHASALSALAAKLGGK